MYSVASEISTRSTTSKGCCASFCAWICPCCAPFRDWRGFGFLGRLCLACSCWTFAVLCGITMAVYAILVEPRVCAVVQSNLHVTEEIRNRFIDQRPDYFHWVTKTDCPQLRKDVDLRKFYNDVDGTKFIGLDDGLVSPVGPGSSDKLRLTAWYLRAVSPEGDTDNSPAIVTVHGFKQAATDFTQMVPASMLRKMGISVFSVNQRNYCQSDENKCHCTTLGSEERLDIEAAVRYLEEDPKGLLGVKRDPSRIGIFSVSGGPGSQVFLTNGKLAALWLDSAVYDWGLRFQRQLHQMRVDRIPFLKDMGWFCVVKMTSHLVKKWNPAAVLADTRRLEGAGRRVFVTANRLDKMVLDNQAELWIQQLSAAGFRVDSWLEAQGVDEPDACDEHVTLMVHKPEEYRRRLCSFWSSVWPELPPCSEELRSVV